MNCKHTNIKTLHEETGNRICLNCYQHWYNGKEYRRKEWDAFVNSDAEEEAAKVEW